MAGTVSNELKKLVEQKNVSEVELKECKEQIECLSVRYLDVF
jgi:hypothetical protein